MNAQKFFSDCSEIIMNGMSPTKSKDESLEKISSFDTHITSKIEGVDEDLDDFLEDENDFLEDENDFLEDDASIAPDVINESISEESMIQSESTQSNQQLNENGRYKVNNINISLSKRNIEGSLYDYFLAEMQQLYGFTSDNYLRKWNARFNATCDSEIAVIHEFCKMKFAVDFRDDVDIHTVNIEVFKIVAAIEDFVTVSMIETVQKLKALGFNSSQIRDCLLVSKVFSMEDSIAFVKSGCYSSEKLQLYSVKKNVFVAYTILVSKNLYDEITFDNAISVCNTAEDIIKCCNSDDMRFLQLVSNRGENIRNLTKQALQENLIEFPFINKWKEHPNLQTILIARIQGYANAFLEDKVYNNELPEWAIKLYEYGKLAHYQFSDDFYMDLACNDAKMCKLSLPRNLNREYVKNLVSLKYSNAIQHDTYLQLLALLCRDNAIYLDFEHFKSINQYYISKIADEIGSSIPISMYIGRAIVIVDENCKVRLLDVDTFILSYDVEILKIKNKGYRMDTLARDAGVLIAHNSVWDKAQRLKSYVFASQSSLERWSKQDIQEYKPWRYNLEEVLHKLDHVPEKLLQYRDISDVKYTKVDRCFSYALDIVPELYPVFEYDDTALIIKAILPNLCVKNKGEFVWKFLYNVLSVTKFLSPGRIGKIDNLSYYESIVISYANHTDASEISLKNFFSGFSGFLQSIKNENSVGLFVKNNKILIKIF